MSVPVFNPNSWCLLYFSMSDSDVLPVSPDEFFSAGPPYYVQVNLLSQAPGIQQVWNVHNPEELYAALTQAFASPIYTCSGKLFTVHKTGLLERLQNWRRLAGKANNSQPGAPGWALPTVDIVEEFHRPAILTFQQRAGFSAKVVNFWLGYPTTSTQHALWRLCHIL